MAALQLIMIFVVFGVASSELYDYEIDSIKPTVISVSNIGGRINVTVKYSTNSLVYDASSHWWVNGKRVADRTDRYKVDELRVVGVDFMNSEIGKNSLAPPDEDLKKVSILIPGKVRVSSLELQIVSDIIELGLSINVNKPPPGKTIFEYLPKFKPGMIPSGLVAYNTVDEVKFLVSLAGTVRRQEGVKAEFIESDQCITPPIFERKTSEEDKDFFETWIPTMRDKGLKYDQLHLINNDNYMVRRLKINSANESVLPKGILSVSAGYKGTLSCGIFSGVWVTYVTLLQPPPHSDVNLLPEKTLAFLETKSQYFVNHGEDLDITITAIGGKMAMNRYSSVSPTHPEVNVRKRGKKFKVIADIKRLFQREITIRFKKVTAKKAGRYVAVAKSGKKMIKKDFFVFVRNPTGSC